MKITNFFLYIFFDIFRIMLRMGQCFCHRSAYCHFMVLILVISSLICNIHLRKDIPVCDVRILNLGVYVLI